MVAPARRGPGERERDRLESGEQALVFPLRKGCEQAVCNGGSISALQHAAKLRRKVYMVRTQPHIGFQRWPHLAALVFVICFIRADNRRHRQARSPR